MRYDPGKDRAPRVVAKGQGKLARKIIDVALRHHVPVHEDPDVVEILSKLRIDQQIPYELYQAVAQILAFVYRENERWKNAALRC